MFGLSRGRRGVVAVAVAGAVGVVLAATLTTFAVGFSRRLLRRSDRGIVGDLYDELRSAGVDLQIASLLVHFGLFAGLGAVAGLGLAVTARATTLPWYALVGALLMALATASELGQFWVDGRSPNTADWFADVLGACVGLAAALTARRAVA